MKRIEDMPSFINPFKKENCKASSYDLIVGREYYIYKRAHKERLKIESLREREQIIIPPNSVCYVLSEESVALPRNITGSLSLRMGLMKQGIIMPHQSSVDPGYKGKLVATLYNLSDEKIVLAQGEHLMSIEFHILDEATEKPYGQGDDYQELNSLNMFLSRPVNSSLNGLRTEIKTLRKTLFNWNTFIISTVSLIMLIVSIVIAIPAFVNVMSSSKSKVNATSENKIHTIQPPKKASADPKKNP